jgi:hypothetical protein
MVTPLGGDLGSAPLGTTGPAKGFTVTNPGAAASGPLTVVLSGPEFVITNDTCTNASLPPGGSCAISVALQPKTAGAKGASLAVSGSSGNRFVVFLTGQGLAPAAPVAIPASIDFGNVAVGVTSASQTVTIRNSGGTATGILNFTRSGNYAVFPITANLCSPALGPGATCTFVVSFAPTTAGRETAAFTVTDGTFSLSVTVSGNGI